MIEDHLIQKEKDMFNNLLREISSAFYQEQFSGINSLRHDQYLATLTGNNEVKKSSGSRDDAVAKSSLPKVKDPSYIELCRIALCYFIAKADGVSQEEQAKIDAMCEQFLSNPQSSSDFRAELRMILADKGTSFSNLRRYLNRIETEEIRRFMDDVRNIAETSDGITEKEKKAILIFMDYLDERKTEDGDDALERLTGKPSVISLKCESCGSNLNVTSDKQIASCPYCGSSLLIVSHGGVL